MPDATLRPNRPRIVMVPPDQEQRPGAKEVLTFTCTPAREH
jgi:hypothetical protein